MTEQGSKYYSPTDTVSILPLCSYDLTLARAALDKLLAPLGGLDFVLPGQTVVIKANLVSAMKPSGAATTHPTLICALVDMLKERGAEVIIGDSPGGLYNAAFVGRVYRTCGMHDAVEHGARLNDDFSVSEATFPEARVLKSFTYTAYLDKADHIINFAKLKSHGMMSMSAAAKNMFGTIPGITKPEYHYRFPSYEDFSDMILDLDEYFHPRLSIVDAVVGMEVNGPTAGTPRQVGCFIASASPHTLDLVGSRILGFELSEVPTLLAARRRGLIPDSADEVSVVGNVAPLVLHDFERVVERRSIEFSSGSSSPFKRLGGRILKRILRTKPRVKTKMCVGCGICAGICPAKTIVIKDKKARIRRRSCIRCFCCQEFCPKSAIKVERTVIARLLHKKAKKDGTRA